MKLSRRRWRNLDYASVTPTDEIIDTTSSAAAAAQEYAPLLALWRAVIVQAFYDAAGEGKHAPSARAFLFGMSQEWRDSFNIIADAAGLHPEYARRAMRARLEEIRNKRKCRRR